MYTPKASQEVEDVYEYLFAANPAVGRRFRAAFRTAIRSLVAMPLMGAPRPTGRPEHADLRMWYPRGFPNYVMFYLPTSDGILVVRVLHAARDIESILRASDDPLN